MIAVTIAIIIAASSLEKIPGVAAVGGVIGVSISASFLLLLAVLNSVSLWQTVRAQKGKGVRKGGEERGEVAREGGGVEEGEGEEEDKVGLAEEGGQDLSEKIVEHDLELASPAPMADPRQTQPGLLATTCLGRLLRPLLRLIDRPWKLYPVGLLFGSVTSPPLPRPPHSHAR